MIARAALVALLAVTVTKAAPTRAAGSPSIRVGLVTGASQVRVASLGGGLLLAEPGGGWEASSGPVLVGVREAARPPAEPASYRVLVRTEPAADQARRVADALKRSLEVSLRVEDRGAAGHAVVAGPYSSRSGADELAARLAAAGLPGVRVEEVAPAPSRRPARLVVVDAAYDVRPVPADRIRFRSASAGLLEVDGLAVRGELEVRVDGQGRLTAINTLPLEDYVRGVVPKELGPEHFPELEALKAQAVAARTWVLGQLGGHERDGYDTCPTPRCQVYGGASAEHPLSDRAVEETAGLVLAYEGRLARAYYSSTCGGHTEAVENVFDEEPVPYLRGVPCHPEQVAFTRVDGRAVRADWVLADGRSAGGVLAELAAVGVVSDEELVRGGFDRRLKGAEAAEWLRRAASLAGLRLASGAPADVDTALGLVRWLVTSLGWLDRQDLMAPADLQAAARFAAFEGLPDDAVPVVLLALKGGLLPAGLEPGWEDDRTVRGSALELLHAWLTARGTLSVEPARFLRRTPAGIEVYRGTERLVLELPHDVLLASGPRGGPAVPRASLSLKLGDKVRAWRPRDRPVRLLQLEEDPDGAGYDRQSAYSWWTRRTPMEAVALEASRRLGLEGVTDLAVARVSPAGRVVAIDLVGRGGARRRVEGFEARGILGLPDTRCRLSLERDASGRVVAVRAAGRGWGHGVGLCQHGAFGMALSGVGYRQVLAHYYPGTSLARVEDVELTDAGSGHGP